MATKDIFTLSAPILSALTRKNPCSKSVFLITGYSGQGFAQTRLTRAVAKAADRTRKESQR